MESNIVQTACIIDDDPIQTFLFKKMISIQNLAKKTIIFNEAKQAFAYIFEFLNQPEKLPDVILLDINMPEMNGWDFLKKYEGLLPYISKKPTLYLVSSSSDEKDKSRAEKHKSIEAFKVKPLRPEDLKHIFSKKLI